MKRKRTNSLKSSRCKTIAATTPYLYLPDECWESVFKFLINNDDDNSHRYLESLSLISKQFLSITNPLRLSLTFYNQTRSLLPHIFQRFTNVTSLDLSCYEGDLNKFVRQISRFPLNLTSLNLSNQPIIPGDGLATFSKNITTLTSFTCSNLHYITSDDLFLIAKCFPLLEELNLSHPQDFNDYSNYFKAIEALSLALSKLRKVDLSRHCYLKDQSIYHLFEKCKLLEEAVLFECYGISNEGIARALLERPKLSSLSFSNTTLGSSRSASHFSVSFASLKGLTCLDLSFLTISDELLSSIAMKGLPLTRLVLQNCKGYTYFGIFCLLSKCRSIQHLDLQNAEFLNDQGLANLSSFLGDLVSINLSECEELTNSALFTLVRKCPSLSDIKMEHTSIGKNIEENSKSSMDFISNPHLKSLYLARNSWLRDESLIEFASTFPNLQLLDLTDCDFISEEVICQVLRRCCKIRHLNLTECNVVKLLGLNFEVSKLEVLNLTLTMIDDETLHVISKNCCRLLHMILEKCVLVTMKGVKHVIKYCTQLKEINLRGCDKVHLDANTVALMVFTRLSLRKITAPPSFSLRERNKLLSRQVCIVC